MIEDNELDSKDFENFDKKTREEKKETLQKLQKKLEDGEDVSGLFQNVDLEGELTVKVLDGDGGEKHVETQEFKA